jgi:hypothetical protein
MGGWLRWRRRAATAEPVIDLRDSIPVPQARRLSGPFLPDNRSAEIYAALVERRRAEVARAEAQRELEDLRRRHWSADRVFEESRLGVDWWEHPLADPHAVLGLVPGDSYADATAARRAIAKAVHPDVAAGDEATAEQQMVAVNAAYERMRRALGPTPNRVGGEVGGGGEVRSGPRWSAALAPVRSRLP